MKVILRHVNNFFLKIEWPLTSEAIQDQDNKIIDTGITTISKEYNAARDQFLHSDAIYWGK